MEQESKECESPTAWRPEAGKTAWYVEHFPETRILEHRVLNVGEVGTLGTMVEIGDPQDHPMEWLQMPVECVFPTAEAALASIKVYDLMGEEVLSQDTEELIAGHLELAGRGMDSFLGLEDLQVKAKIEEAMRCNEAGLKSATSLHLGEALRLLKERARNGGDLTNATLADHGITYDDERRNDDGR